MLNYKVIYQANKTARRLKNNRYGGYYGTEHNRESDILALFTIEPVAQQESLANLELIMTAARQNGQRLVVFKPDQIQVAGVIGAGAVADWLFPGDWVEDYREWLDSRSEMRPSVQSSQAGEYMNFHSWRRCLAWTGHQGVYDVDTGRRLTNRRDIIERMWDLGFAAQRGRPLSIASIRWTGEREELVELVALAERHWARADHSEMARKMVSAYRSINRYAAWPGAW
jgi:hypothetical protein